MWLRRAVPTASRLDSTSTPGRTSCGKPTKRCGRQGPITLNPWLPATIFARCCFTQTAGQPAMLPPRLEVRPSREPTPPSNGCARRRCDFSCREPRPGMPARSPDCNRSKPV